MKMKIQVCVCVHRHRNLFLVVIFVALAIYFLIMVNIVSVERIAKNFDYKFQDAFTLSRERLDYQPQARGHFMDLSESNLISPKRNKTKLILIWCPLFEGWNFLQEGNDYFKQSGCSEARCEITLDRKRLLESDAVLFHVRTMSMLDIPKYRRQDQKWIFFSLEAPPYSQFSGFNFLYGMFNWTMTYREDSDVVIRYGRIISASMVTVNDTLTYSKWKKKTRMAVWMVSHCSTDGNREAYIENMQRYIDVDTYGGCGLGTCPFNKTEKCLESFSEKYFFFMSFENAICNNYITEKYFRALNYDMIPVVFGGGNYTLLGLPESYIDARDFPSPKSLSSHLLKVASNFTLFSGYFKWRNKARVEDNPNDCELCKKLHSDSFHQSTVYYDLNKWWIEKSQCQRWNGVSFVKQN